MPAWPYVSVVSVVLLVSVALLASGCALDTAAIPPDTGLATEDSAAGDGGGDDAQPLDSATGDGRIPDARVPDTGARDSAATDTGAADSGPADSSPADTGAPDTGPADTGPSCVPSTETCDGVDQDCDGLIDEGTCSDCTRSTAGGSTYLVCSATERSYSDAVIDCRSRGYDLAVIESAAENAAVAAMASGMGDVWIGLSDADTEGTWVWVDGQVAERAGTALMYVNWRPGEPGNGTGDNCTELDPADSGYWNDVGCTGTKPTVCEVSPP